MCIHRRRRLPGLLRMGKLDAVGGVLEPWGCRFLRGDASEVFFGVVD
jgi:hypothetical protein